MLYALRVNISIAMVAMVKSEAEMAAAAAGNATNQTMVSFFNSTTNTTYMIPNGTFTSTTPAPNGEGEDCPEVAEGGGTKVVGRLVFCSFKHYYIHN